MIRDIVLEPHSILRRTMLDIGPANRREITRVLTDLKETMIEIGAVGLAANQIGEEVNICIVAIGNGKILELVNPLLLKRKGKYYSPEACMSIPNYSAVIPRFEEVQIGHFTRDGKTRLVTLALPYSVRAQHEIDHLHGILIKDYVEGKNGKFGGMDANAGPIE